MLFGAEERLEETIVRLLAERPDRRAGSLHQLICKEIRTVSLKAVYKALHKLQLQGIAVCANKTYNLKLPWVLSLVGFAETLSDAYLTDISSLSLAIIPKGKEKKVWKFSTLRRLNLFWTQVIHLLSQISQSKVIYDWVPHPWFHLTGPKVERQFLGGIVANECSIYRIVGGDSYLDRFPKPTWDLVPGKTAFAEGPFRNQQSTYYVVTDDIVNTVTVDAATVRRLEALYQSVASPRDLDIALVNDVLSARAMLKMQIVRNPVLARSIAKKFSRYFGLRLKS